jgi:hypothetical protein
VFHSSVTDTVEQGLCHGDPRWLLRGWEFRQCIKPGGGQGIAYNALTKAFQLKVHEKCMPAGLHYKTNINAIMYIHSRIMALNIKGFVLLLV